VISVLLLCSLFYPPFETFPPASYSTRVGNNQFTVLEAVLSSSITLYCNYLTLCSPNYNKMTYSASSSSRLLDHASRLVEMVSRDQSGFCLPTRTLNCFNECSLSYMCTPHAFTYNCMRRLLPLHASNCVVYKTHLHFQKRVQSTLFTSAICLVKATILRRALSSRGADSASCM
jgi:hypothetical protein